MTQDQLVRSVCVSSAEKAEQSVTDLWVNSVVSNYPDKGKSGQEEGCDRLVGELGSV